MNQKDVHLKLLNQRHFILTLKTQCSSSEGKFRILRRRPDENYSRGMQFFLTVLFPGLANFPVIAESAIGDSLVTLW